VAAELHIANVGLEAGAQLVAVEAEAAHKPLVERVHHLEMVIQEQTELRIKVEIPKMKAAAVAVVTSAVAVAVTTPVVPADQVI
jgi:ABC-type enterobactin transport system permease subunit